jgi:hypothetical protein
MIKPTTDADVRGFLKSISSRTVWPFISKEKLVKSEQFARLIKSFDEHFSLHRDTGQFERVLAMLDGSKYRDVLAEYLRVRHGVQVSREDEKIKISLLKKKSIAVANREMSFTQFLAMPRPDQKIKKVNKTEYRESPFKKNYVDALDHPARLPGSFGHGSRK